MRVEEDEGGADEKNMKIKEDDVDKMTMKKI